MSTKPSRHILSPGRVAELCGVSHPTLALWVRQGKIACEYTQGNQRRYTYAAVRKLLQELGRPIPVWLAEGHSTTAPAAPEVEMRTYPLGADRGAFLFALPPEGLQRHDVDRIQAHLLTFVVEAPPGAC